MSRPRWDRKWTTTRVYSFDLLVATNRSKRGVEEHALLYSMSRPLHVTRQSQHTCSPHQPHKPKTQPHQQVLALCHGDTLVTVADPWVAAGHPQYTGARFCGRAVDGPINPLAHYTL